MVGNRRDAQMVFHYGPVSTESHAAGEAWWLDRVLGASSGITRRERPFLASLHTYRPTSTRRRVLQIIERSITGRIEPFHLFRIGPSG